MGRTKLLNFADTFWGNVEVGEPHECWPWTGTRTPAGYGRIWVPEGALLPGLSGTHNASRAAYFLEHRHWPGDLFVCHSCDNPPCVNPRHLWLGTTLDNTRDSIAKGRRSHIRRSHAASEAVLDLYERGTKIAVIARTLGVSRPTVYKVIAEAGQR